MPSYTVLYRRRTVRYSPLNVGLLLSSLISFSVMHLAGLGQIVHRRWSHIHPHDTQSRTVSGCPHLAGQKQLPTVEKSSTALTVLAEAGMISLDAKRDR